MNNMAPLVEIINVSAKQDNRTILQDINLSINPGEQWAIIGKSGSGKTTLAHALTGTVHYTGTIRIQLPGYLQRRNGVMLIEQQHRFKNLSNTSDFYYQQRFNSSDSDNAITVEAALRNYSDEDISGGRAIHWLKMLRLDPLLQKPLIQLSNGENKRLQLAEALLSDPALLVLDNPFTGLDSSGRIILGEIIDAITSAGVHVILVTSPDELPRCITHVALLEKGVLAHKGRKEDYKYQANSDKSIQPGLTMDQLNKMSMVALPEFNNVIKMVKVGIRYGNKIILENIDWEVKRSDCWSVSGPNGAGKSTLLSLITADNPQAYANEIYLFGKRRGKGESIWDIKKLIGYVSPELHLFFEQHNTCFEVIASGLFDTIGLFRQINEQQSVQVECWLELLGLLPLRDKPLFRLSLGEQRMVLLGRALVKNPPVLILDEPCQGLDEEQSGFFKNLIDLLCRHFGTTLLYVSHYERDIPACVTRFLRLENGRRIN